MTQERKPDRLPAHGDRFATTHWSMVVSAGGGHHRKPAERWPRLCENYWFPLYAFVRRAGHSAEDAEDLTQEFFARLLAQALPRESRPPEGQVPLLSPGGAEAFPGRPVGPRTGPETRRKPDRHFAGQPGCRDPLSPGAGQRSDAREDVREAMGPVAAGAGLVAAPRRNGRRGKVGLVRGPQGHADRRPARSPTQPSAPSWA